MAGELARHRLEQRVAGGVAVLVVDRLEAVEIDEQQRRLALVALQIGERALELALEAAPVEDVEQRIDVGARFEFGDRALAPAAMSRLEPLDLGQQQSRGRDRRIVGCRLVGLIRGHVRPPFRSDQSGIVLTVRFSISPRTLA